MVKLVCAALLLAACYQPELRDCTIACEGGDDCAGGQVCGSDGWCAAPEAAGTCAIHPDGAVPPDAALATLHIVVEGKGKLVVDPLGVQCAGGDDDHPGDCSFDVAPGTVEIFTPIATHAHTAFGGWTSDNCASAADTCTVTVTAPITLVGASFVNDH